MSKENEIVITLTEAEWDQVRLFLSDTLYDVRGADKRARVRQITGLLAHNANKLTLDWIDRQMEDFA